MAACIGRDDVSSHHRESGVVAYDIVNEIIVIVASWRNRSTRRSKKTSHRNARISRRAARTRACCAAM